MNVFFHATVLDLQKDLPKHFFLTGVRFSDNSVHNLHRTETSSNHKNTLILQKILVYHASRKKITNPTSRKIFRSYFVHKRFSLSESRTQKYPFPTSCKTIMRALVSSFSKGFKILPPPHPLLYNSFFPSNMCGPHYALRAS